MGVLLFKIVNLLTLIIVSILNVFKSGKGIHHHFVSLSLYFPPLRGRFHLPWFSVVHPSKVEKTLNFRPQSLEDG